MREYTEYTREEKAKIINKGGNEKRELENAFSDFIRYSNLDNDTFEYINNCDPAIDVFYHCESVEELQQYAKELFQEEIGKE